MKAHVFFKEGKLYLIPELPIEPNSNSPAYHAIDNTLYKQAVEKAKANALPVVNPDAIDELYLQSILEGKFYKWPGTWENDYLYKGNNQSEFRAKLIAPQPSATKVEDAPNEGREEAEQYAKSEWKKDHTQDVRPLAKGYLAGYNSLRDQLSKEREQMEIQIKAHNKTITDANVAYLKHEAAIQKEREINENLHKAMTTAEQRGVEKGLEEGREVRKELLTKIKKICGYYVHHQDWIKFSYEFDIEIEKASELDNNLLK